MDGFHERAGSVYLIIEDDGFLATHMANHVQRFAERAIADAALLDDGQRHVQDLGKVACAFGSADIGGHHDRVFQWPFPANTWTG